MKKILQYLFEHKTLSKESAKEVLLNISKGMYSEHEVTAFITVFLMRSITIEELQGFRDALLDLCVKVNLNGHKTMDIVGTGGDGKNTFNISTLSCFIVAGTGLTIIHGLDGYDEISLTNDTKVITNEGEYIKTPQQLGKRMVEPQDIYGGNTPEEAAKIFLKIIKGEGSWAQNAVVLANAAMALNCTGDYANYNDAYQAAVESLESGKAYQSLQKLISLQ